MSIYYQSVFDKWPIDDGACQLIATSPPYYALRKYDIPDVVIGGDNLCQHDFEMSKDHLLNLQAGNPEFKRTWRKEATQTINNGGFCIHCSAWKGQYGLEPKPFGDNHSYLAHTLLWAKEAWRVLRNDGIFFLNIADSYSGSGNGTNDYRTEASKSINGIGKNLEQYKTGGITQKLKDYKLKCKLMIPERIAIGLIDAGWTLRNSIVWYKSNAMPESVTDRFSKKYETIFMFTKQGKYYFNLDSIREPHKEVSIERLKRARGNQNKWVNGAEGQTKQKLNQPRPNYKDRIGSMQNTEFEGSCAKLNPLGKNPGEVWSIPTQPSSEKHYAQWPERLVERMIKCSTKPGDVVLDCFAGSCTTGIVAESLHRKFIGIELGYADISKRRMSQIQKKLLH